MKAKHARKAAKIAAQDDDDVPENIDDFRNALARKIHRLRSDRQGGWRSCREPLCRREHACRAPRGICGQLKEPRRPMSAEQKARNIAQLYRALRERSEQLDAEREQAAKAHESHKKS